MYLHGTTGPHTWFVALIIVRGFKARYDNANHRKADVLTCKVTAQHLPTSYLLQPINQPLQVISEIIG
jgi:hypothetical protein